MVLTKKELGQLIKKARNLKSNELGIKYTQQMLSNDIGKSQSYIGDIESGRTYPSFIALNEIANACNVSITYFQNNETTNNHIDKFIKHSIDNLTDNEVCKIREALKKDPDAKINYIYDSVPENNNDMVYETSHDTPEKAIMNLLKQQVIIDSCGLDINKISDTELLDFSNEVLHQIKLLSYKYQK